MACRYERGFIARIHPLFGERSLGMSDIDARFWELCDRATWHNDAHFQKFHRDNAPDDEAYAEYLASVRAMVELVRFVEANSEYREAFVRCFCDLVLWKRPHRFDLVAFCMRRLRFPEIPELIHRDADAHDRMSAYYLDHMSFWSIINRAYLDEVSTLDKMWEEAEESYGAEPGAAPDPAT